MAKTDSIGNIATTKHPFNGWTAIDMLSVNEGIPIELALERASAILASVQDIGIDAADSGNGDRVWGMIHLVATAKGMIDATLGGILNAKREAKSAE